MFIYITLVGSKLVVEPFPQCTRYIYILIYIYIKDSKFLQIAIYIYLSCVIVQLNVVFRRR